MLKAKAKKVHPTSTTSLKSDDKVIYKKIIATMDVRHLGAIPRYRAQRQRWRYRDVGKDARNAWTDEEAGAAASSKFIPLKFVTQDAAGKKSSYAELNLTSMVDMLTILVVFLLQTFSASGELLSCQKNIILPEALNFSDLEQAPVIARRRDSVTLNGGRKPTRPS